MKGINKILLLLLFLISIPIVLYAVKQRQTVKQEAQETQPQTPEVFVPKVEKKVTLSFTLQKQGASLTQLTASHNQQITLFLYINTQGVAINGFDVTIQSDNNLTLTQIAEGDDAARFDISVFNDIKKQRLAKVSLNTKSSMTGIMHLATYTFVAKTKGVGTIRVSHATVTTLNNTISLVADLPVIAYTSN